MPICLPDVNVWFALAAEGHPHHIAALKWFALQPDESVAFCRITQMGLLRLLTNPRLIPRATATIARAWETLDEMRSDRRSVFAWEPDGIEPVWRDLISRRGLGPSSWTDAYLAAFAACHKYSLVTFDTAFHRWQLLDAVVLRG